MASDSEFGRYINTKKDIYDDEKYITPKQLMTSVLNNNEVLLTSIKWN